MEYADDPFLFPLVREPASRWERSGLSQRQERAFNRTATLLVGAFLTGWVYTVAFAPRADLDRLAPVARVTTELTRSPLATDAPPDASFLLDQFVRTFGRDFASEVGGLSGAVQVQILEPGETVALPEGATLPEGAELVLRPADGARADLPAGEAPRQAGIWNLALRMRDAVRPASTVSVITMVPLASKRQGRIGDYRIGSWPYEQGGAPQPVYRPPAGLIEVTPENMNLQLTEHLQLRDFLTKGQTNVWPKYVAVDPRILDKLELVFQELEAMGHPVENIFAVSGFRTPDYNVGGGNPAGRGALSRHMYGDAMDIAIDNDRDGLMDDLTGDGRVTMADLRIVLEAVERVERKHPHLVGGVGLYRPTGGHRGMVHIDARGFRARW
jgi:uncharacterized protein YcbK (DUF882 family)